MNLTVHMPARKGTDMKAEKTEEQKRQEGGELIQFVQTCAGELLKGTSLSVLSPYLLHYKITFTIKGSVGEGDFLVHYDWDNQHLEFQVRLSRIVPKEHIERAVRLLNLINIESSCVNFVILQESGQVGLSLDMFLGDNLVSRAKIRKAIILILNDATNVSLFLHWLSTQDVSPDDLHQLYLNARDNIYLSYPDSPKMSRSYRDRALRAVAGHFHDIGGGDPLNSDYVEKAYLHFDLNLGGLTSGRMIIDIQEELEIVSFRFTPMKEVSENRAEEVLRILPPINFSSGIHHFTLDPEDRVVVLNTGILLDDGMLHAEELTKTVGVMFGTSRLYLPLLAEFSDSEMTPEEMFDRLHTEVLPKVDMKYRRNMFEECYEIQ